MRYLIHRLRDGTLYHSPGVWVRSIEKATDVGGKSQALALMRGSDLGSFTLLVMSEDGGFISGHALAVLAMLGF